MEINVHITGIERLVEAIEVLTRESVAGSTPAPTSLQMTTQGVQTMNIPAQPQLPVNQSMQGQTPVTPQLQQQPLGTQTAPQQMMQPPVTPTVLPTTNVVQSYTQDQLAVAAAGLVNAGKQQRLMEILNGFGVQSLVELPKEQYGAFAGAIKAEGAVF